MHWPLKYLRTWRPFQIDALGLVTLLGSEEVNAALGRLVPSRYVEFFPLLGAFVVAGDRFKEKKPSFNLYNITQGIHTTDLSCWLTRWMLAQDFGKNRAIVHFEVADKPHSVWAQRLLAGSLAFVAVGGLLVMTILFGDWYGLANVSAMIISVVVRTYIMEANRHAIDRAVEEAEGKVPPPSPAMKSDKKCLVVMSDSKAVTLYLPGHLIIPVFVENPHPANAELYHAVRWIGWIAFAVHVLSIGMTDLICQIYSVVLIVVPTVLICWKWGCDDSKLRMKGKNMSGENGGYVCWFGSRIKANVFEWPLDFEFTDDPKLGIIESGGIGGTTTTAVTTTATTQKDDDDEKATLTTITTATATTTTNNNNNNNHPRKKWYRFKQNHLSSEPPTRPSKRQDLYAWLHLSPDEEESMGKWDLFPHERNNNKDWIHDYLSKKALIQMCRPEDVIKRNKTLIHAQVSKGIMRTMTAAADSSDGSSNNQSDDGDGGPVIGSGLKRQGTDLTASGAIVHHHV